MKVKKSLATLCGLSLIGAAVIVMAGEEGRPLFMDTGTPSSEVVKSSTRQKARSGREYIRHEREKDTSRTKPIVLYRLPQKVFTPVSLQVVNPSHHAINGVPLTVAIAPYKAPVIHVTRSTNSSGNLDLSKVGPLPVDIKVYSADKAKWRIADAKSTRFVVTKGRRAQSPEVMDVAENATTTQKPVLIASLRWPTGLSLVSASLSHTVVRYVMVKPTQVKATIKAPPGSSISSPVISKGSALQISVPDSGEVVADIPSSSLEEGAIPVVVSKKMPGGDVEAVIDSYATDDPDTSVASPPLRLASLNSVKLADATVKQAQDYPDLTNDLNVSQTQILGVDRKDYLGVLSTDDQIDEHKHELGKRDKHKMNDDSQWWIYEKAGIAFKMRKMVSLDNVDKTVNAAERVRILSAAGGSVGGVSVGDMRDDVIAKIGDPQIANDPRRIPSDDMNAKGDIDTYLDNGLRICYVDGKVAWMDVTRPNKLLLKGTTAFVPRGPARLYVAGFRGTNNSHCSIGNINDFKHYLSQLPSVKLVGSEDEADLRIDAGVSSFTEDKKKLLGIIPTKYECTTALVYNLYDENTGRYIAKDKVLTGSADVSISKVVYLELAGTIAAFKVNPKLGLAALIGTAVSATHKIQKAGRICPPVSVRQAFNNLTQDISNAVDFSARVTDIDYERGLMTLNVGSDVGVRPSTTDQPFEFRVALGGTSLGDSNSGDGRHVDYYDAVVRTVTPTSCVCEFQHVKGLLQGDNQIIPSNPDKDTLSELPDPATGLISAQATVNFPLVTVISDNDIEQMKTEISQWGEGVKNNPQ